MYALIRSEIETVIDRVGGEFNRKKILITGGAGFLGSWLSESLLRLGGEVTCLDNFAAGSMKNIRNLTRSRRFHVIRSDVSKWRPSGHYELIIHGASTPVPEQYTSSPIKAMLPNSIGLHKLLDSAKEKRSIFLYMSTSEIYGDAKIIPTPEEYPGALDPLGPRACYYESKRYGETACLAYHRELGVDVRIVRIFNTYGPRIDAASTYSRVIPRFVGQALANEDLTIHGDGTQTRSFCYVTDTIEGILKVMTTSSCNGEALNIGHPGEITVSELAERIIALAESHSSIKHEAKRPDDPSRRCPDISKARKLLGWEPKVSLEDGLVRTIEWFKHAHRLSA